MNILKLLDIHEKEKHHVLILLLQSLFLGGFYGSFDIGAHAIFLDVFDGSMIPKAFFVSGLVGIVLTSVYSLLHDKLRFSLFSIINLFIVLSLTLLLRLGFLYFPGKTLPFVAFVLMGPLNILVILGFWGTTGRIFDIRQGKRLFSLIDAGQIIGIIIASYAIPLLISLGLIKIDLLLVSGACILGAILIQILLVKKIDVDIQQAGKTIKDKTSLRVLMKNNYVQRLSVFVGLSVVIAFFIHYIFIEVTKSNYPNSDELAKFLGFFNGTMMTITLLLKTFFVNKILKTYGMKVSLMLGPVILFLFSGAAIATIYLAGYDPAVGSFIFFFLVISLAKLFSKTLHDAVEVPAFKVLYQAVDASKRFKVQTRIDGTINEIAAVTAGLFLTILSLLAFINLEHFLIVTIVLVLGWVYFAYILYHAYHKSLGNTNNLQGISNENCNYPEYNPFPVFHFSRIQNHHMEKAIEILSSNFPVFSLERIMTMLLNTKNDSLNEFALRMIKEKNMHEFLAEAEYLTKYGASDKVIALAEDTREHLAKNINLVCEQSLNTYFKSDVPEERKHAPVYLAFNSMDNLDHVVLSLLRDVDKEVIIESVKAAYKFDNRHVNRVLCEYINDEELGKYAEDSLKKGGEKSFEALYHLFCKDSTPCYTKKRIISIIAGMELKEKESFLLELLSYKNRSFLLIALKKLITCGINLNLHQKLFLFRLIKEHCGILLWKMHISMLFKVEGEAKFLKPALEKEIQDDHDILFDLLMLCYDDKSILKARKYIEAGSREGMNYALEMLDNILDFEIKQIIITILDSNHVNAKIQALQDSFYIEPLDASSAFESILNKNVNYTGIWMKACCIYDLCLSSGDIPETLVAQLFHPHPLIRETAIEGVKKINPLEFEKFKYRVPGLNGNLNKQKYPLFNKLRLLHDQPLFSRFHPDDLVDLAMLIEFYDDESYLGFLPTYEDVVYIALEKQLEIKFSDKINQDRVHVIVADGALLTGVFGNDFTICTVKNEQKIGLIKMTDVKACMWKMPELASIFLHNFEIPLLNQYEDIKKK